MKLKSAADLDSSSCNLQNQQIKINKKINKSEVTATSNIILVAYLKFQQLKSYFHGRASFKKIKNRRCFVPKGRDLFHKKGVTKEPGSHRVSYNYK